MKADNTDLFTELKQNQTKTKGNNSHQMQKTEKGKTSKIGGGFGHYNLSQEVLKGIKLKGYNLPTPIQRKVIPSILQGFNVIAMARTGSGKTGAFIIPVVEKLKEHSKTVGARTVILSPTREIALQTAAYFRNVAKFTDLTLVLITGGNDMENQFERLLLNPDVIIATPGRLMHCIQETNLQLSQVQMVVYDEADRIFELGFAEQLHAITERMPKQRQSLLFSATISSSVKDFTLSGIKDYKMVQVDKDSKLSDDLKCHFVAMKSHEKMAALLFIMQEMILQTGKKEQSIIFCATRHHVEYIYEMTRAAQLKTTYIFGMMDQETRESRLMMFRQKKIDFLIVTDLAARGIDIPLLQNVIHFDFPTSLKLFIHRSGRTARAGEKGTSYTFVTTNELAYLHDTATYVGKKFADCPELIDASEDYTNEKFIEDPSVICYGRLPQHILDEYTEYAETVKNKNKEIIKTLSESMTKALIKYNRTKDPASAAGIQHVYGLNPRVHPMLLGKIDEKEQMLMDFRDTLKAYKPKASTLEIAIIKRRNLNQVVSFTEALQEQNRSKKLKDNRLKMYEKYKDQVRVQTEILEKNQIEMIAKQRENAAKLEVSSEFETKNRMSKKRKAKVDKIKNDDTLTEAEKQNLLNQMEQDGNHKKQKRSQMEDFKDGSSYVTNQRDETTNTKNNQSSLWGEHEKNFLEDVTMNLIPDEDASKNFKGKTAMKWDAQKKRYILKKVDREGKVIAEKRNESGQKITKKMKENKKGEGIYKKWQQKTHLNLQKAGEQEDTKAIEQGKRAVEGRNVMKDFKRRHGSELYKGTDARSNQPLIDKKKQKFMEKIKETGKKNIKGGGGRKFSDKANKKIVAGARPTRSKMIVKAKSKR